jgi:hypothetical protein
MPELGSGSSTVGELHHSSPPKNRCRQTTLTSRRSLNLPLTYVTMSLQTVGRKDDRWGYAMHHNAVRGVCAVWEFHSSLVPLTFDGSETLGCLAQGWCWRLWVGSLDVGLLGSAIKRPVPRSTTGRLTTSEPTHESLTVVDADVALSALQVITQQAHQVSQTLSHPEPTYCQECIGPPDRKVYR